MKSAKLRKAIADETLQILEQGRYEGPQGEFIALTEQVQRCVTNTRCYTPAELAERRDTLLAQPARHPATTFTLRNESTLEAARRLAQEGGVGNLGVLNFASAKNPGGGFLRGTQAQEESLARSAALYLSLLQCPDYYAYHRARRDALYSDHMIYSPACPVFRTDEGTLLAEPYTVDFITSAAPNAGVIRQNEPQQEASIEGVLHERGGKLLALAASQGCETLLLGAWGCGVFRNDPPMVAEMFRAQLGPEGPFWGRFLHVHFAVLDRSPEQATLHAFQAHFE